MSLFLKNAGELVWIHNIPIITISCSEMGVNIFCNEREIKRHRIQCKLCHLIFEMLNQKYKLYQNSKWNEVVLHIYHMNIASTFRLSLSCSIHRKHLMCNSIKNSTSRHDSAKYALSMLLDSVWIHAFYHFSSKISQN